MCLSDKLAIITPFSATIRKDFFDLSAADERMKYTGSHSRGEKVICENARVKIINLFFFNIITKKCSFWKMLFVQFLKKLFVQFAQ